MRLVLYSLHVIVIGGLYNVITAFGVYRVDHMLGWLCVIQIQEKCLNLNRMRTLHCNVSYFINIFVCSVL